MTEDWREAARAAVPDGPSRPRIEPHPERDGVRLVDPIGGTEFMLSTPGPVETYECATEQFYYPVDTAVSINVDEFSTPYLTDAWIRDSSGELVADYHEDERISVPEGSYIIDISGGSMKIYLSVQGSVDLQSTKEATHFHFSSSDSISIGARSMHEQPAERITTTEDPKDVLAAISTFGSALKTTSSERSYPTLRGHPPLLQVGDRLEIPESISTPDTGIKIEIPPEYRYIIPITTLSYYLGATVSAGKKPCLYADGDQFSLTSDGDFESTVQRFLKHIFIMDCVTRTEGFYPVELHERTIVEQNVDIAIQDLYGMRLDKRLKRYLEIPYKKIEEAVPEWKMTADVLNRPRNLEALPFLANELAQIRCISQKDIKRRSPNTASTTVQDLFEEFETAGIESLTRSSNSQENDDRNERVGDIFYPAPADSLEQTHIGNGIPISSGKIPIESFYRRLECDPTSTDDAYVAIVCNDNRMSKESIVSDIYGQAELGVGKIEIMQNLSIAELERIFEQNIDFLHYIGHIDQNGFDCCDGSLDAKKLNQVNVNSFLLNACESYAQGNALVENGSVGGAVTISKLSNEQAVTNGRVFAELLVRGSPLGQALAIITKHFDVKQPYTVVGGGNTPIIESETHIPEVVEIRKSGENKYDVSTYNYFSNIRHLGTFKMSIPDVSSKAYLCGNKSENKDLNREQAEEMYDSQDQIVIASRQIPWAQPDFVNIS